MPGLVKIGQTDDVRRAHGRTFRRPALPVNLYVPVFLRGKILEMLKSNCMNYSDIAIDRYEKEFFKMNWLSVAVTLLCVGGNGKKR